MSVRQNVKARPALWEGAGEPLCRRDAVLPRLGELEPTFSRGY